MPKFLEQQAASFSCKRPERKDFKFCRPCFSSMKTALGRKAGVGDWGECRGGGQANQRYSVDLVMGQATGTPCCWAFGGNMGEQPLSIRSCPLLVSRCPLTGYLCHTFSLYVCIPGQDAKQAQ